MNWYMTRANLRSSLTFSVEPWNKKSCKQERMTHLILTLIYLYGATTTDVNYNCQIITYSLGKIKIWGFKIFSDINTELKNGSKRTYWLLKNSKRWLHSLPSTIEDTHILLLKYCKWTYLSMIISQHRSDITHFAFLFLRKSVSLTSVPGKTLFL